MAKHRIYTTRVASVYPHYVAKAEKKGRTQAEVDQIILWLTGYRQAELAAHLAQGTDFETFFAEAPRLNPSRTLVTGVVCGVRIEEIEEPTDAGDPLPRQARRRVGARKGHGEDPADAVTISRGTPAAIPLAVLGVPLRTATAPPLR